LLAGLHRKAGRVVAGLGLIDEALAIADANSESWCNVELHRERGELLLMAAGEEAENQADAEFKAAIETAVAQGAKLPELRASVARAKLQAARGRRQQARDILAPIYSWFSEGLETSDLAEARTFLADL
jgi:predicted ATPase